MLNRLRVNPLIFILVAVLNISPGWVYAQQTTSTPPASQPSTLASIENVASQTAAAATALTGASNLIPVVTSATQTTTPPAATTPVTGAQTTSSTTTTPIATAPVSPPDAILAPTAPPATPAPVEDVVPPPPITANVMATPVQVPPAPVIPRPISGYDPPLKEFDISQIPHDFTLILNHVPTTSYTHEISSGSQQIKSLY